MSVDVPNSVPAGPGSAVLAFLFLTVLAMALLGTALVLGVEPRLWLERTPAGTFRVTAANYFAGHRFYARTIEGVEGQVVGNAVRAGRRDPERENRKRRRSLHLAFAGANGSKLRWDRETDGPLIEAFMRGQEPTLALAEPPPRWRMGVAWCLISFGALVFLGAIQSSFFPPKTVGPTGRP